jgi:2-polyprenyl-3-methyl-5-hydroxy-6-metoxy-1,4-benzoquinol methylase
VPGYQVRFQHIEISGGADLDIRALLDRQQYHDPDGMAEAAGISPACWPLFGQIWPSAQKLADLMQTWVIGNQRVLEIGCGLALASLVLHRRGENITASDCHPLTELFIHANLLRNALPAMNYSVGNWGRANPALGRFDLIIGSDVLYERNHPEQLAEFIERHAEPRIQVLIIDPNRSNRGAFNRAMHLLGFSLVETVIKLPLSDGSPYRGRLLNYQRSAESTIRQ